MVQYAVEFQVIIDGGREQELGTIGSSGTENDYYPNAVKDTIRSVYMRRYPNSKVAVLIRGARKLRTPEEYQQAAKNFITLTTDNYDE